MGQKVNLIEALGTLVRHRRTIALCTVGALLISAAVSLLLPAWYKARATILPPESAGSQLDIVGIMRYAGYQPGLIPSVTSPSEVYAAILKSTRVKLAVIDSLDLEAVYGESDPEELLAELGEHTWLSTTGEGIVVVECEDKQPRRAKRMVDSYVRELDRFNTYSRVTSARAVRRFIETRISQVEDELDRAETQLKAFKDSTGAVLISEQSRVSIETAAELYGMIAELEVRKERLSRFATGRSPEIIDIESQIAALERKLEQMGYRETGAPVGEEETILFPRFSDAADLELSLARLMRDVEVKRAVFAVLSEQYEQARIQELKDMPTLQVLDWGREPTIRSRPRRKVIVGISTVCALLLSGAAVFVRERARRGEYSRERETLVFIKKSLAEDVDAVKNLFAGG
jgi:uncharacterized protein involved in exopolysaccharide biosynthesis